MFPAVTAADHPAGAVHRVRGGHVPGDAGRRLLPRARRHGVRHRGAGGQRSGSRPSGAGRRSASSGSAWAARRSPRSPRCGSRTRTGPRRRSCWSRACWPSTRWSSALLLRDKPGRPTPQGSFLARTWATARIPATGQLSLLYAMGFGGFVAFSVYLPTYLVNAYDLTASDAAARTAGFVVLAVAMRPVGGTLSDKVGPVPVLMVAFVAAGGPGAASPRSSFRWCPWRRSRSSAWPQRSVRPRARCSRWSRRSPPRTRSGP